MRAYVYIDIHLSLFDSYKPLFLMDLSEQIL
jgi:hypothetical protein